MRTCKIGKKKLALAAAGELSLPESEALQDHLRSCPECRGEMAQWQRLLRAAARRGDKNRQAAESIDWDGFQQSIIERIRRREAAENDIQPFRRRLLWRPVAATLAAAAVFVVIFFHFRPAPLPRAGGSGFDLPPGTIETMENSMARQEILGYLSQSQMVLTDLLETCAEGAPDAGAWETRLHARKARDMLLKKKYCNDYLEQLPFSKAKSLCDQIDFLFSEVAQLPPTERCAVINHLQEMTRRENLLLKIRLLEKDLSYSPATPAMEV